MDEFREGSKCDPWIVQALSLDLPQTSAAVTAATTAAQAAHTSSLEENAVVIETAALPHMETAAATTSAS